MIGGLASVVVLAAYRVVGAAAARRRLARHALAAARERRLARPQHRRSAQRTARRRLRLPPRRRSAGQQGAAAVRPRRLDHRSLRRAAHTPARAPVRSHAACASGRSCSSLLIVVVANVLVFWSLALDVLQRTARSRSCRDVRAVRGRRVDDRVRRTQLGARRHLGSGRSGAAARAGDGADRCARSQATVTPDAARRARSASAM